MKCNKKKQNKNDNKNLFYYFILLNCTALLQSEFVNWHVAHLKAKSCYSERFKTNKELIN